MESKPKKQKICSRGHAFHGSGPCPICWPGYYKKTNQNKYKNEITKILKQTHPKFSITYKLEFKNVFGAVGGYVNGRIFASGGKFGVAFRLSSDRLNALFREKKAKRLRYFPKGHVKKEYAVLPKRILKNKRQLKKLVVESIQYVLSLKS